MDPADPVAGPAAHGWRRGWSGGPAPADPRRDPGTRHGQSSAVRAYPRPGIARRTRRRDAAVAPSAPVSPRPAATVHRGPATRTADTGAPHMPRPDASLPIHVTQLGPDRFQVSVGTRTRHEVFAV